MPTPRDSWTLARLLADRPVNDELGALSGPFGAIGRRLAGLPSGGRQAAWDAFLDGRDDRDEIILTLADADPDGPAPDPSEDGAEADDGWGPIRLGTIPPAGPFPLDVLPIPARDLAEAAARSIGCPADFPAVATLAVASAVIGRSAVLLVKPGYRESAGLYAALVGGPSSGKSPSLGAAFAPVAEIVGELHERWRAEKDAWEARPAKERGPGPTLRRITTTDPTTEALGPILAANPRGIAVIPDEMTKWVMSMDQYKGGKGGDRPFYLSAWGGEAIIVDRAKFMNEPIVVPDPFLTVAGGLTPGMLSELSEARGRDDGFTARLLFAYPERVARPYSEEGIPDEIAAGWREVARSLWARQMLGPGGGPEPHVVEMDPEARREWAGRCQDHRAEQESPDFPGSLEGPWGKLEAYAARLALILHLMDLAADPTAPRGTPPPELPRRIIRDAWRLVAYFKGHARRAYASMGGRAGAGSEDVRALLGWIGRNRLADFTTRDAKRNLGRFKDDDAAFADATDWLIGRNVIRRRPEPQAGKPGRRPSPAYDVNPAYLNSPRNRQNRQNPGPTEDFVGFGGFAAGSEDRS